MQHYPNFPTQEPRGPRTWYGVIARFSTGEEREVGREVQGDPEAAGRAALFAWHRYHGTAHVEVWADGEQFAYVTFNPRTHDKTPFLCQPGFCAHHLCGQIPPDECFCQR